MSWPKQNLQKKMMDIDLNEKTSMISLKDVEIGFAAEKKLKKMLYEVSR